MLLFTAKTHGLIDRAVRDLPDESRRRLWRDWAREHSRLKVPGGPVDDDGPPAPRDVVLIALAALEQLEATKRQRLNIGGLTEDEISDLEGDLTYISAVSHMLRGMPVR
jgi:hypothetical protein